MSTSSKLVVRAFNIGQIARQLEELGQMAQIVKQLDEIAESTKREAREARYKAEGKPKMQKFGGGTKCRFCGRINVIETHECEEI